jgi:hypothetical protein
MNDMNAQIRRAAGRQSPQELAAAAIDAAEQAGDARALRERLATDAGLPLELASRLHGNDAGELKADAEALAETLAELRPPEPEDMNSQIRRAAGRAPAGDAAEAEEEPMATLDGGARRSTAATPPPSMNSLMRAAVDHKHERIAEGARDYDDLTN